MSTWQSELPRVIDELFPRMVSFRRHMHAHPELSGAEYATTSYLREQLTGLPISIVEGPDRRGLIVDLTPGTATKGEAVGGRLALRADIDALPISDQKTTTYCSRNEGVMHACGHDAHTAVVWGALLAIEQLTREVALAPRPNLRVVFQPAEETGVGAQEMIAAGCLVGVDAILACHVDPSRQVGRIGLRTGPLTASCDDLRIVVRGKGGHAARPHETRDPIAAAVQLVHWMYAQIPRTTDSQDAAVISVGKIAGGQSHNVIPEQVEILGTVRTLDQQVREQTCDRVRQLAAAVALGTGTSIEVEFSGGCRSVLNDARLTELLRSAGTAAIGMEQIDDVPRPSMGSEDFAAYCEFVPAAMFRLGCRSESVGGQSLHTPLFDIDEQTLRVGCHVLAHAAMDWASRFGRL